MEKEEEEEEARSRALKKTSIKYVCVYTDAE
jgi:hypothetical protein